MRFWYMYCKFENFREDLFSRNFAYAKFRENIALAKWYVYNAQVVNF